VVAGAAWQGQIHQIDPAGRVVMGGQFEIAGELGWAVARCLGLQLDHSQPLIPQHPIVRRRAWLLLMAFRQVELVDVGVPMGSALGRAFGARCEAMPAVLGTRRLSLGVRW
jgi:hypothetical protein